MSPKTNKEQTVKVMEKKERSYEISIFQTTEPRPRGTAAQLLLVLTTFVICFFIAMILADDETIPDGKFIKANPNSQLSLNQGNSWE